MGCVPMVAARFARSEAFQGAHQPSAGEQKSEHFLRTSAFTWSRALAKPEPDTLPVFKSRTFQGSHHLRAQISCHPLW